MSDCMTFPDTVDEFMEFYKVVDTDQVYSNGTEYVPIFRMKQWFEHLQSAQPKTQLSEEDATKDATSDCISRQDVITSFRLDDDGKAWSMEDIIYRIEQFPSAEEMQQKAQQTSEGTTSDTISRQAAIDAASRGCKEWRGIFKDVVTELEQLPSAQPDTDESVYRLYKRAYEAGQRNAKPERDIPKKPNDTIDRSWGISTRQAVCPNCDCYLGQVHFLGDGKRKVTYCETCGQAIDWTDWEVEHDRD